MHLRSRIVHFLVLSSIVIMVNQACEIKFNPHANFHICTLNGSTVRALTDRQTDRHD